MIDVQITKQEATERKKQKFTSAIGVPLLILGVFMIACKIYDAITGRCPKCDFSIYEILLTVASGYALFTAKDTLITAMFGMLLPKKGK